MREIYEPISEIISSNLNQRNIIFVFPTDVVRTSWIDWVVKNPHESKAKAVNMEQFIAWDQFKSTYVCSKDDSLNCVPPVMRKIFAQNILQKHCDEGFFSKIISPDPQFKPNVFNFTDWIAKLLPSLKLWNEQHEKVFLKNNTDDEENLDFKKLYDEYVLFLKENNFYEPSYLEADYNPRGNKFIIFYPEILEDYAEFQKTFSNEDSITLVHIPDIQNKNECIVYDNARKEIRRLALNLRKLQIQNVDLRKIAVNVPDLDKIKPYIERELTLYSIPYTIRQGVPFTTNCGGDIFIKINECIEDNFSFDSIRSLLQDGFVPWKNPQLNESLIRKGQKFRCICSIVEDNRKKDMWEESLSQSDNSWGLEYYKKLKLSIQRFSFASSFAQLKTAWDEFKKEFFDEAKFLEPEYELSNKIIARIITKLNDFISIEKQFLKDKFTVKSVFNFFINEIKQDKYTPNEKKYGVNVFPYRLSVCADFEYQFIINANQSSINIPFKKLKFINDVDKRKKFGLEDADLDDKTFITKDVSVDFVNLYALNQRPAQKKHVYFSNSIYSFDGFTITHTSLSEFNTTKIFDDDPQSQARLKEIDSVDDFDFVTQQTKMFISGTNKKNLVFSQLQKKAFENWSELNYNKNLTDSQMSSDLITKIDLSSKRNNDKIYVSPSSLKSFFRCPLNYMYTKILNLDEDSFDTILTSRTDIGTFNHKIIEMILNHYISENNRKIPELKTDEHKANMIKLISEIFDNNLNDQNFAQSVLAKKIIESQKSQILDTLSSFMERLCTEDPAKGGFAGYTIEGTEIKRVAPLSYPVPKENLFLYGYIDCFLSKEDVDGTSEYAIIDFKSGSVKQYNPLASEQGILEDFQIASYVNLLETKPVNDDAEKTYKTTRGVFLSIGANEVNTAFSSDESKKKTSQNRDEFNSTLVALSEYANYMYSKILSYDFRPANKFHDKNLSESEREKFGLNPNTDCTICPFNSICRTSFSISGNKI